ncbi:hypothetical protein PANDA_008628, partial [Ailuropoda melanoleuca]
IHTVEYYPTIKRNDVLIPTTMWMNPKNTMQSERSQLQKAIYCVIPLIGNIQNRQIHRDREQISGCQGLEGGRTGKD